VAVPEHIYVVIGQVMELHVPGLGWGDVVLDVHQEPIRFDLLKPNPRVVQRLRLDLLHPRRVGVDVEAATVLSDERHGFGFGNYRHAAVIDRSRSRLDLTGERTLARAAPEDPTMSAKRALA
jgi:hypothetical protein